jgi:hypothetical protein
LPAIADFVFITYKTVLPKKTPAPKIIIEDCLPLLMKNLFINFLLLVPARIINLISLVFYEK